VKPGTNGEWRHGGETETTFEAKTEAEKETLKQNTIDTAIELMENTQPNQSGSRTPHEALSDIIQEMESRGLPPVLDKNIDGIIESGHANSLSYNIRPYTVENGSLNTPNSPDDVERLLIKVHTDGKEAGLSFTESVEKQGEDDLIHVHDPVDKDKIHYEIRKAVEQAGFNVSQVKNGGHQRHWDHSVNYNVEVKVTRKTNIDLSSVKHLTQRTV